MLTALTAMIGLLNSIAFYEFTFDAKYGNAPYPINYADYPNYPVNEIYFSTVLTIIPMICLTIT